MFYATHVEYHLGTRLKMEPCLFVVHVRGPVQVQSCIHVHVHEASSTIMHGGGDLV